MQRLIFALLITASGLYSVTAEAYVGPGLGVGTIGVIIGVIASIFLALFAVVWYPIKRLIKRLKKKSQQDNEEQ